MKRGKSSAQKYETKKGTQNTQCLCTSKQKAEGWTMADVSSGDRVLGYLSAEAQKETSAH